jgi:hypothetical protein
MVMIIDPFPWGDYVPSPDISALQVLMYMELYIPYIQTVFFYEKIQDYHYQDNSISMLSSITIIYR